MTYLKNGGQRVRVIPVNPQTADQQAVRAAFLFFTKEWSGTLTQPERDAWVSAKADSYWLKQDFFTGTTRQFNSGKSLFIAMNMNYLIGNNLIAIPQTTYLTPGTSVGIDAIGITSVTFDASAGTAIVVFTGTVGAENLMFRATPPLSVGFSKTTSVKSKFRVVSGDSPTSPWALGTQYVAKFGAITGATGQKVFWVIEGLDLATGRTRLINQDYSIIVA